MELSIREVREEDAAAIVRLLNPIIRAGKYSTMDEPITVDDQIGFIRGFPEEGVYHAAVVENGRRIVGIQDVQPVSAGARAFGHVGEISTFVSLTKHRSGVGTALTKATLRRARELRFRKLMAVIRVDNPQAIAFYRSQGFEKAGVARGHALVSGKPVDEVLMESFID